MGSHLPNILPGGDAAAFTSVSVLTLLDNVTRIALGLVGAVALIYLIIGAYNYLTAYGNEDRANAGKKTLTWAIVGIVVVVAAELIVTAIVNAIRS